MIIGYVNGLAVIWNERDRTTRVRGTCIMMTGSRTRAEAVEQATRNLKYFRIL